MNIETLATHLWMKLNFEKRGKKMFTLINIINIVLCFIMSIPFFYISMFIHEVGHALIASIGGMKPRIYMHRKSMNNCKKNETKNDLSRILEHIYPKGCCQINVEGATSKSIYFWLIFYFAGVIAQLILMGGVIFISLMHWGDIAEMVKLFLLVNVIMLVDAIVPKKYKDGYHSDGKYILEILQKNKKI